MSTSSASASATEFYWSSDHPGVRANFALASDGATAYITLAPNNVTRGQDNRRGGDDNRINIPSWKPLLRADIIGFDDIISGNTKNKGLFEAITSRELSITGTQLQHIYEYAIPEIHDDVGSSTFLPDPNNDPQWWNDNDDDEEDSDDGMSGWEPRPKIYIKLNEPRLVDVIAFMFSPWDRNFGRRVYPTYSVNGVDFFPFMESTLYASIPRVGNLNRGNPSLHNPKVLQMRRHQPIMIKYIRLEFPNGCGRRVYSICVSGPIWWPKVKDLVKGLALVQQGRATLIPNTVKDALDNGKSLTDAIGTLPVDCVWNPVLSGVLKKLAFSSNKQSATYRLPQTTMYILSFL